jgi:hypothetical protein
MRWKWLLHPLLAFVITRAVVWGAAYLGEIVLPDAPGEGFWHALPDNVPLDILARWDSGFYRDIAETGYSYIPGQHSEVAFFPLYPLAMRALMPLAGGSAMIAGIFISHVCLLLALILLYRLSEQVFEDSGTAVRTVYYIAAFPTAFFFSAVYTESMYLLFTVATAYFARNQRWLWATLAGIAAAATRVFGVLMIMIVLLEWARSHGWTPGQFRSAEAWRSLANAVRRDWAHILVILMIPVGLFGYMLYLHINFGDGLLFWRIQATWERREFAGLEQIVQLLRDLPAQDFAHGRIAWNGLLNIAALFAVLPTLPAIWRRLGPGNALYTAIALIAPAMTSPASLIRYMLVLFPIFMILGEWGRREAVDRALMISFAVFLGLFTAMFVNWIFIA